MLPRPPASQPAKSLDPGGTRRGNAAGGHLCGLGDGGRGLQFQNGIGAREKALAGAGVASSTDATAVSLNPAGLANVESQLNVSASFLFLNGGYSSSGPLGVGIDADGHHDSNPGMTFIPNLAVNWRVNWGLIDAIAFSAYGNGGVSTHYGDIPNANCPVVGMTGVFCGGQLGVKLSQSFYSIAFAKQVMPGALGRHRADRRLPEGQALRLTPCSPASPSIRPISPTRARTNSWGVGVRGGVEFKVAPGVRVGVAGNTPINMSNFDKYRGILAEQGDFDIPATIQVGIAVDLRSNLTVMADYKRIWFSSVASVGNPSTNFLLGNPFGADNGGGFGVQDVDVVKIGVEWRHSQALTLRAGYSYNTAPITSRDVGSRTS